MLYFDTSFLAPLVLAEVTSDKIEQFMWTHGAEDLAVSHWTRAELSSLLAREVRMGTLTPKAARTMDREFEEIIEESFIVLLPSAADFELSKEYLQRYSTRLRAGDALHLAIAANGKAQAIYSLDRGLLRAGEKLGLPVRRGIRLP